MKKRKRKSVAEGTKRFREANLEERQRQVRHNPTDLPLWFIYNKMPVVAFDNDVVPTMETRRQADILFEKFQQTPSFKPYKVQQKREHAARFLHALKKSMHKRGCILNPHCRNHPDYSKIRQQIIECAIEVGLVYEIRSPKGSPKMSRILPMPKLNEFTDADPWTFDPDRMKQLVFLRDSEDKSEIPIDFESLHPNHIANLRQERLELVNAVNSQYEITYSPYDSYERDFAGQRQLRPIHYAIFTGGWEYHGRIYTGQYGHQSLRKIERRTIEFSRCGSVELDYGGYHSRMLYHLLRLDCEQDPHQLWGPKTTPPQRLLAKTLVNVMLNAKSRTATISQCNWKTSIYTKQKDKDGEPVRKTGDALLRAVELLEAQKQTGLSFSDIYDLAVKRHKPISRYFNTGAGLWLMSIDSAIAIDIMNEFSKQAIPILGVHDSFIVPEHHEHFLREQMNHWYHLRFQRFPVIK